MSARRRSSGTLPPPTSRRAGAAGVASRCFFLVAFVASAAARPAGPRFSWNTLPVFFHSCNYSGPFTDAAIRLMARFPLVTVEKGQGVKDPSDGRPAEDKIVDELRRVKQVDANVSTVFYYNSKLDWPFYRLHQTFLSDPSLWLRSRGGDVCRLDGDGSFPNHTGLLVFDFAQAKVRDLWAEECLNMTRSGFVDGCFSDRAADVPCGAGADYRQGNLLVHQQVQRELGEGLLIANNAFNMPGVGAAMIEYFRADEGSIHALLGLVTRGVVALAHSHDGCDGDDPTHVLAAFLVAAGDRSYFGCSRAWSVESDPIEEAWLEQYDHSLGSPEGLAEKDGTTYRRRFIHADGVTAVEFDVATHRGSIRWAQRGGRPTPRWPRARTSAAAVLV